MALIDKDTLVLKIEKRIKETESMQPKFDQFWAGQISAFKGVIKILDTLETEEVNLEKEYEEFVVDDPILGNFIINDTMGMVLAKHFFELGMQKSKGEQRYDS